MTKADIVEKIAKRTGKSKREAEELTKLLFDLLKGALAGGEDVRVSGFGFFDVKEKAARTGRNPQTGEEITIEGRKVLGFRPAKALKDAINAE